MKNLIKKLQPTINQMVQETIDFLSKKELNIPSRKYLEIEVSMPILKVMANYLKDTDVIEIVKIRKFPLRIEAWVKRDGKSYWLETEQIVAGGMVQRDHYRYIIKGDLRKIKPELSVFLKAKEEKKRLNKIQRIEADIERLKKAIIRDNKKADELEAMTEEEALKWMNYRQYEYNPENPHFESYDHWKKDQENYKNDLLESHKDWIRLEKNSAKNIEKTLKKAEKKLADLLK